MEHNFKRSNTLAHEVSQGENSNIMEEEKSKRKETLTIKETLSYFTENTYLYYMYIGVLDKSLHNQDKVKKSVSYPAHQNQISKTAITIIIMNKPENCSL